MKARIALFLLALSAVALAVWEAFMLSGKVRTHAFVYNETGLRLPVEVRIVSTRSHLFSLVDGVNYEWLIQSDQPLATWAASHMSLESGGWEDVRSLAEFGGFKDEIAQTAALGAVWRSLQKSGGGDMETSYLYLSQDGRVGVLQTFRP
jgi:hypothetical protein